MTEAARIPQWKCAGSNDATLGFRSDHSVASPSTDTLALLA
jgi:hypothetical protein